MSRDFSESAAKNLTNSLDANDSVNFRNNLFRSGADLIEPSVVYKTQQRQKKEDQPVNRRSDVAAKTSPYSVSYPSIQAIASVFQPKTNRQNADPYGVSYPSVQAVASAIQKVTNRENANISDTIATERLPQNILHLDLSSNRQLATADKQQFTSNSLQSKTSATGDKAKRRIFEIDNSHERTRREFTDDNYYTEEEQEEEKGDVKEKLDIIRQNFQHLNVRKDRGERNGSDLKTDAQGLAFENEPPIRRRLKQSYSSSNSPFTQEAVNSHLPLRAVTTQITQRAVKPQSDTGTVQKKETKQGGHKQTRHFVLQRRKATQQVRLQPLPSYYYKRLLKQLQPKEEQEEQKQQPQQQQLKRLQQKQQQQQRQQQQPQQQRSKLRNQDRPESDRKINPNKFCHNRRPVFRINPRNLDVVPVLQPVLNSNRSIGSLNQQPL